MKVKSFLFSGSLFIHSLFCMEVGFEKDIQPLLKEKCYKCHNHEKQKGGLDLTLKRSAFSVSDSGYPALVENSLEKSELWHRIITDEEDDLMPPKNGPLSESEKKLLKAWIEQGAVWPEAKGEIKKHWAYISPEKPPLPKGVDQTWVKNEVDAFILAKMKEGGLTPNPPASKEKWLRRVSLDLIGLPPTEKELTDFLKDTSDKADEVVIDRLLDSPHYGEYWATYWLDMARFADSGGYQADPIRSNWAYRDWVIKAFNNNMPYNQFSIEQLAGDLIENATLEQRIATGFHRNTTCNVEAGVDPEENRVNQIVDRVNVTGTVWLGTTLECAQCHNHKYDPFSQKEYYQILSFFNNTPLEVEGNGVQYNFIGPKMNLPLTESQESEVETLELEKERVKAELVKKTKERNLDLELWREQVIAEKKSREGVDFIKFDTLKSKEKGVTFSMLKRNQILVSGANPEINEYTLVGAVKEDEIIGVRLEAIKHDSLPSSGVGREEDRDQAAFGINHFQVQVVNGDKKTPLNIKSASASYHHKGSSINLAFDKSKKTSWSITGKGSSGHEAYFLFDKAYIKQDGDQLEIVISQNEGKKRTLGSFGISSITKRGPWENLSEEDYKSLILKKEKRTKKHAEKIRIAFQKNDPDLIKINKVLNSVVYKLNRVKPSTSLVMVEMEKGRDTHIMKRGDFTQPGLKVAAGVPSILPSFPEGHEQNRLGFAKWLFQKENPLVSRTAVNRYWLRLMGKGLVLTPEDLGTQADDPTHPALLDWLATTFVESGWNVKELQKHIVMSQTYRQSSLLSDEKIAKDSNNIYYSYMKRRRLSAESIRDNMLRVSGLLNKKMYGPPAYPPQPKNHWVAKGRFNVKYIQSKPEDRYRRSVYTVWKRSTPYVSYVNFDAPDRSSCVIERPSSNTPIQALTLMNDPIYMEFSKSFGIALMDIANRESIEVAMHTAFKKAVTRSIQPKEVEFLVKKFDDYKNYYQTNPELSKLLVEGLGSIKTPEDSQVSELAAWMCITNIILNLDEVVMRG